MRISKWASAGLLVLFAVGFLRGAPAHGDSTSPRLAAYYGLKMALCGDTAYRWEGADRPNPVARDITQVGVGRDAGYALTRGGALLAVEDGSSPPKPIAQDAAWFAAGRSGLFVGRRDGALLYIARPTSWFGEGDVAAPVRIAPAATAASIGDSADYFVAGDGTLHVKGLAHRGQYGDGKLTATEVFVPVLENVVAVKAHTGHAIALTRDGTVMGTGGNIYGPLGAHGIGDKATTWGPIFEGAAAIATGSSHSLALRPDGSLWHWGRDIGLEPRKVLDGVTAAAADRSGSIALLSDGRLLQWHRGEPPREHFRCPPG